MNITCHSLNDLPQIAQEIVDFGKDTAVWLFNGDMGAGKTTTIKAICKALGVHTMVQSPTFALVNEYATDKGDVIYHFDCYRLKNEYEALDFGIEEYFSSGNYCFVEWASKISSLLPIEYLVVEIAIASDNQRIIQLKKISL
jgi:tRNA threonylcarbamoyladenosine biosynthesis protein TsaE